MLLQNEQIFLPNRSGINILYRSRFVLIHIPGIISPSIALNSESLNRLFAKLLPELAGFRVDIDNEHSTCYLLFQLLNMNHSI
jgi:hypothetical protein